MRSVCVCMCVSLSLSLVWCAAKTADWQCSCFALLIIFDVYFAWSYLFHVTWRPDFFLFAVLTSTFLVCACIFCILDLHCFALCFCTCFFFALFMCFIALCVCPCIFCIFHFFFLRCVFALAFFIFHLLFLHCAFALAFFFAFSFVFCITCRIMSHFFNIAVFYNKPTRRPHNSKGTHFAAPSYAFRKTGLPWVLTIAFVGLSGHGARNSAVQFVTPPMSGTAHATAHMPPPCRRKPPCRGIEECLQGPADQVHVSLPLGLGQGHRPP